MEPNEASTIDSRQESPIQSSLLANLIDYGVATDHIGFAHVTMQSSSFICVREQRQSAKSSLKIFDLRGGFEVSEKPMAAEAALMNPEKPHLALRAGGLIQVFDIDTKEKISSVQADFPVIYWCWISSSTLAMVSDRHVYHWDYTTQSSKMTQWFDKSGSLSESQIIALQNEPQYGLAVLCGIGLKADRICGSMQLYSAGKKASQLIDGYCCCFFKPSPDSAGAARTVLAYASLSLAKELRLHLTVIEPHQSAMAAKRVVDLDATSLKDSDFPLSICFDMASKLLILHTKHGHVYIIDPVTGVNLYSDNLTDSPLYLIVPSRSPSDSSHFYLTRAGGVHRASVVFEHVLQSALNQGPSMFASVGAISERLSASAQKDMYRSFFDRLRGQNRHHEALQLLALSSKAFLRTFEYMTMVKEFPSLNSSPALLVYFALILESGSLNEAESIELAQLALRKGKLDILRRWLEDEKIYCTEHLGDLIFDSDVQLADSIYKAAGCAAGRINCCAASGNFSGIDEIMNATSVRINLSELLKVAVKGGKSNQAKFIDFALASFPEQVTAEFVESILEVPEDKASVVKVLSRHAEALSALSQDQIMLKVIGRLIKYEPTCATEFIMKSGKSFQSIADQLQTMLKEAEIYLPAFLMCTQHSEAAGLADFVCEEAIDFSFLSLRPSEVTALIEDLMKKDPQKYAALCGRLASFIESSDRLAVKPLIFDYLESRDDRFKILAQWMKKAPDSNVMQWYFDEAISLGKTDELEATCLQHVFDDPRPVFETLKNVAPSSNALKILAKRYSLLVDLIVFMESRNDHDGIAQVIDMSGDELLTTLPQLVTAKIKDETVRKVVAAAAGNFSAAASVASELEGIDRLDLLCDLAHRSGELGDNRELYSLKAKILCAADDKDFATFTESNISKLDFPLLRDYCERKRPEAMLELYSRTDRFEDLLRLSQKIAVFGPLLKFLVFKRDPGLWLAAITKVNGAEFIEKAVTSTDLFIAPEEASALAKCLVSSKRTAELVRFLKSLIDSNPKFSRSRTTQTLLLLNLLSIDDTEFAKYASSLDCYDFEEVAHAAISAGKYALGLAVLKQAGLWQYSFQVCLHGCGDLNEAAQLAQKCNDGKVNAALAEHYLSVEDHEGALDFAMKSTEFASHHALLGLLELQGNYSGMHQYLNHLRATRKLSMSAFERFYLSCSVNLDMAKELNEIVASVNVASAEAMGTYLLHHGRVDAAIACFQRAGSHEHLVSCYLQRRDLEAASDSASKCNNPRLWLRCCKACLRSRKYHLAEPLALKCLSANMSKDVFSAYNATGAFSQLIDLCETFVATNPTKAEIIFALGRTLNLHRPDSLEGFIQKYYSVLSDAFVEVLKKHRRWKEAFKFYIMRSELELALNIMLVHPSNGLDPKKIFVLISKINRKGIFEKGLEYFHNYYPTGMVELQRELHGRVDLPALIAFCRGKDTLWIIEELLKQQQGQNLLAATEASVLNEQLLRSNDYYGLLESIRKQPSIDFSQVRSALASSELRHFRILAAKLGANSGGLPTESLKVLVQEDAVLESLILLAQCGNREYAEAFLSRYSRSRNAVMFVAVAYVLFDQIRFDVLLEWMTCGRLTEAGLPLMCQVLRNRFP